MIQSLHIYLVDDNDIDIAVNSKLLELANIGKSVRSFGSAVRFLNDLKSNPQNYTGERNILLLDIMMPGMSGFDFLDEFAKLPQEIVRSFSVFMLSSSIDRNDIRRAEATEHVRRVLEKPLDVYLLKKLLQAIESEA
jgi:CheY-like chemotaxis protein